MSAARVCWLIVLSLAALTAPARAQTELTALIPLYVGSQISAVPFEKGERVTVTSHDDPTALMIFYRKMLAYAGWQVLEGRVLEGDRTIVFARGAQRLKMTDDSPSRQQTLILFSLTR